MAHFLSHTACPRSSVPVGNETVASMATILGYARVSTTGQDLDAQLTSLAAGVDAERIYTDELFGSAKMDRPGLAALLDYARPGDTVVVAAIDRLGRSVAEITCTIADLGDRRILLRALREGIDTATTTVRADSPQSWPLLPSWSSSLDANAEHHPATPVAPGSCRPPSRRNSVPNGRNSFGAWLQRETLSENWPLPSALGGQRHTVIWRPHLLLHRSRRGARGDG